ncbi:MAG: type II toxin-antitoxin system VapC family toxin [Deltaproteobacteria bacterium]|nr:type II toxin-antitoxin system VapC family toxin [Deltaproteobacteria bacterium]
MIVLDTHALLWWIKKHKRLSKPALRLIERSSRRGVAAISLWEIARLVEQGRVRLDVEVEDWLADALSLDGVELLPLTPAIAARSTRLGSFHGDPADRLIVATALLHDAILVTADGAIEDCGLVETVW